MTERDIRYHSSDDMTGLGELKSVMEPVAVVLRRDGSIDVYGQVAVVDQIGQAGPWEQHALHEHDGYAPHSHEVRADHRGVSR